jgi:hypothetical protein
VSSKSGWGFSFPVGSFAAMGVATVDDLVRLGREALAAAGWESARAFFEQAAEFGESAEILEWLWEVEIPGGRRGVHRFRLETPMRELGVLTTPSSCSRWRSCLTSRHWPPEASYRYPAGQRRTRTASRTGSPDRKPKHAAET